MARHPLDYPLTADDVKLLEAHDYEVEVRGGVMRVRPPASGDWLRKRSKVKREVSFVRERPEAALAVAAAARLNRQEGFRLWRALSVNGGA